MELEVEQQVGAGKHEHTPERKNYRNSHRQPTWKTRGGRIPQLRKVLSQVSIGSSWQRCRIHFIRKVLAHIPKRDKRAVADAVRIIFFQPNRSSAGLMLHGQAQNMRAHYPEAAKLQVEAEEDILGNKTFPREH